MILFQDIRNDEKTITVSNDIKKISDYCFETFAILDSLEEIVLPDSIEEIGKYAFANRSKVTKLNIPKNLKVINYGTCRKQQ